MAGIQEKVAHVLAARKAGKAGNHHCHWTGCGAKVPPAMWGCKKHWYMLPASIRAAIWRTFRPGQEDSKTPSREYVAAAREARDWIAANHPPSTTLL